jgi:hypothetical protein
VAGGVLNNVLLQLFEFGVQLGLFFNPRDMKERDADTKSIAEIATAAGLARLSCGRFAKRASDTLWRDGNYLNPFSHKNGPMSVGPESEVSNANPL